MDRKDLDNLAFFGKKIPRDATPMDRLYYNTVYNVFKMLKNKDISREEKTAEKNKTIKALDKLISDAMPDENAIYFFNGSITLINELNKLTSPRKELVNKSKEELIDLICKFEGILTGLMEKADEDIPEFLKIRTEDNKNGQ